MRAICVTPPKPEFEEATRGKRSIEQRQLFWVKFLRFLYSRAHITVSTTVRTIASSRVLIAILLYHRARENGLPHRKYMIGCGYTVFCCFVAITSSPCFAKGKTPSRKTSNRKKLWWFTFLVLPTTDNGGADNTRHGTRRTLCAAGSQGVGDGQQTGSAGDVTSSSGLATSGNPTAGRPLAGHHLYHL